MSRDAKHRLGVAAAMMTPLFMGFAPVFGRLTINTGVDAYTLAALRTCGAAAVLWIVYLLFFRRYTYIFAAGLLGTLAVGAVNGLGSLLYYNGLLLLDNASMAQLLNMLYVIFAMLMTRIIGRRISSMSIARAVLALFAVYLLTVANGSYAVGSIQLTGALLMIGGAFLFALHVILSQRVMFEMPAPTMALYALTFMGATVLIARIVYGFFFPLPLGPAVPVGWLWLVGLMLVTALSRVTLFAGVREIGGLQAILLNMTEVGVTLLAGFFWLDETLTAIQWAGVGILLLSVILSRWDNGIGLKVKDPSASKPQKKVMARIGGPSIAETTGSASK